MVNYRCWVTFIKTKVYCITFLISPCIPEYLQIYFSNCTLDRNSGKNAIDGRLEGVHKEMPKSPLSNEFIE